MGWESAGVGARNEGPARDPSSFQSAALQLNWPGQRGTVGGSHAKAPRIVGDAAGQRIRNPRASKLDRHAEKVETRKGAGADCCVLRWRNPLTLANAGAC